jgi:choline dehydrogenase-like flavoprotein
MILDLSIASGFLEGITSDVVIVGAGIAGLTLATRLRRQGLTVTVLESGERKQSREHNPLNETIQLGDPYAGATFGRFRSLGGTSTRWGGALIPMTPHDFLDRSYAGFPGFPVGADTLSSYLRNAEEQFRVDHGSYGEEFVRESGSDGLVPTGDPDFCARFAKWPPFKRRNIAKLFAHEIETDRNLRVVVNATVTGFVADGAGSRLKLAVARHISGRTVTAAGKYFVICAGAIESTRLLLLLDRDHNHRIFKDCDAIGRYFYDHISAPLAHIRARDVTKLNQIAGFRFVGNTMRSLRFELSSTAQRRAQVGGAFGHISFRSARKSGFDALRTLMRSQQRGASMHPWELLRVFGDLPYIVRLAAWRVMYRQLLWPDPATYEFHVVAEQRPRRDSFIGLGDKTDIFGMPLATISWRIASEDHNTFVVVRRLFDRFWERHGLKSVGELIWLQQDDFRGQTDVFHPGGSSRMGTDRRTAVVDRDLKVFGVDNLWTASTATFPSGGSANPTLTLILFALRLADHLTRESAR